MLSVRDLVKVYPSPVTALQGIQLDLSPGMFGRWEVRAKVHPDVRLLMLERRKAEVALHAAGGG